jgi:hypothetical protein
VVALTALVYAATKFPDSQFREHIFQAWAFLHGHLYMWDGWSPEGVIVGNRAYWIHPPLSAVAMLPTVLIQGLNASQGWTCLVIGLCGVWLAQRLTQNTWLTAFFGFGTIFWYETIKGTQWGMCLVLGCVLTLATLVALKEHWSPYWIGMLAGLAFLTRYDLLLVVPVYLCLID